MSTFMFIATIGRGPGQWWPIRSDKRSAILYCPDCGHSMHLMNHEIDAQGVVQPSVVEPEALFPKCPNDRCGKFHQHVQLAGWSTPAQPEESK